MKIKKILSAIVFFGFIVGFLVLLPIHLFGVTETLQRWIGLLMAGVVVFLIVLSGSFLFDKK